MGCERRGRERRGGGGKEGGGVRCERRKGEGVGKKGEG